MSSQGSDYWDPKCTGYSYDQEAYVHDADDLLKFERCEDWKAKSQAFKDFVNSQFEVVPNVGQSVVTQCNNVDWSQACLTDFFKRSVRKVEYLEGVAEILQTPEFGRSSRNSYCSVINRSLREFHDNCLQFKDVHTSLRDSALNLGFVLRSVTRQDDIDNCRQLLDTFMVCVSMTEVTIKSMDVIEAVYRVTRMWLEYTAGKLCTRIDLITAIVKCVVEWFLNLPDMKSKTAREFTKLTQTLQTAMVDATNIPEKLIHSILGESFLLESRGKIQKILDSAYLAPFLEAFVSLGLIKYFAEFLMWSPQLSIQQAKQLSLKKYRYYKMLRGFLPMASREDIVKLYDLAKQHLADFDQNMPWLDLTFIDTDIILKNRVIHLSYDVQGLNYEQYIVTDYFSKLKQIEKDYYSREKESKKTKCCSNFSYSYSNNSLEKLALTTRHYPYLLQHDKKLALDRRNRSDHFALRLPCTRELLSICSQTGIVLTYKQNRHVQTGIKIDKIFAGKPFKNTSPCLVVMLDTCHVIVLDITDNKLLKGVSVINTKSRKVTARVQFDGEESTGYAFFANGSKLYLQTSNKTDNYIAIRSLSSRLKSVIKIPIPTTYYRTCSYEGIFAVLSSRLVETYMIDDCSCTAVKIASIEHSFRYQLNSVMFVSADVIAAKSHSEEWTDHVLLINWQKRQFYEVALRLPELNPMLTPKIEDSHQENANVGASLEDQSRIHFEKLRSEQSRKVDTYAFSLSYNAFNRRDSKLYLKHNNENEEKDRYYYMDQPRRILNTTFYSTMDSEYNSKSSSFRILALDVNAILLN